MGYTIKFTLEVVADEEIKSKIINEILDDKNLSCTDLPFSEEGLSEGFTKWRYYKEDIKRHTLNYPGVLFKLYAQGEDEDYPTLDYFMNGKNYMVKPVITYEKFDIKKLR